MVAFDEFRAAILFSKAPVALSLSKRESNQCGRPSTGSGQHCCFSMEYWVYILKCADGSYYTGSTSDLDLRIRQHMLGIVASYTKSRLPVELVYAASCDSRIQAKTWEKQIKGWSRAKKEALIRGDFDALVGLSKSKSNRRTEPVEVRK
jgi:predicted GIY-YIG superfamily endonuclease